jgi:hypothetical protein
MGDCIGDGTWTLIEIVLEINVNTVADDHRSSATVLTLISNTISSLFEIYRKFRIFRLTTQVYAVEEAKRLGKKIIFVHDVDNCPFPDPSEQPDSLRDLFFTIAIPFTSKYVKASWEKIVKRLSKAPNVQENIKTDAFFSHRQKSGQAIALVLQTSLKSRSLEGFLDVQAEFDLHDLRLIVKETKLFVFIVTDGIFSSPWCLKGL